MTGMPFTSTYCMPTESWLLILEIGGIVDRFRIERDDVGPHALFQHATVDETHPLRGKRAELSDRIGEGELMLFAQILAQNARESPVSSRVRVLAAEDAIQRRALGVVLQAFPATLVRRLGHDHLKQENNGWNDLTQNWALKHGFLHACRYRPQTHNAEG